MSVWFALPGFWISVTSRWLSRPVSLSDASAASRNAPAGTIARSNRFTRPSSGPPDRSGRPRARLCTRVIVFMSLLRQDRGHVFEIGQVLRVQPVADQRDRVGDHADQQAEDRHAERDA